MSYKQRNGSAGRVETNREGDTDRATSLLRIGYKYLLPLLLLYMKYYVVTVYRAMTDITNDNNLQTGCDDR